MICSSKIDFPKSLEQVIGNEPQIVGWCNEFLICRKCSVYPQYHETLFRVGVKIEEELGEDKHEEVRKNGL